MTMYFITAMMKGPLESFFLIIVHSLIQETWQLVRRIVEFDWTFDLILLFVKSTEAGHGVEHSTASMQSLIG